VRSGCLNFEIFKAPDFIAAPLLHIPPKQSARDMRCKDSRQQGPSRKTRTRHFLGASRQHSEWIASGGTL